MKTLWERSIDRSFVRAFADLIEQTPPIQHAAILDRCTAMLGHIPSLVRAEVILAKWKADETAAAKADGWAYG